MEICRSKATFIIIAGTKSHDDDQLKLFYHYLTDPTVDVRIVEDVKFEYVRCKDTMYSELYGKDDEYYNKFLFKSGSYDMVFMHGEFKGSIYDRDNKGESHIFDMVILHMQRTNNIDMFIPAVVLKAIFIIMVLHIKWSL